MNAASPSTRTRLLVAGLVVAVGVIVGVVAIDAGGHGHRATGPAATSLRSPPRVADPPGSPHGTVAPATGTAGSTPATSPSSLSSSAPPSQRPVASHAPPGPATALTAKAECLNLPDGSAQPQVELLWTVAAPPGADQRVEVTKRSGGSTGAQPMMSAALDPTQNYYPLANLNVTLNSGDAYTWRVVTTRGSTSAPSPPATFVVGSCPSGVTGGP